MSVRKPSFSIPNAEGVPRVTDVVLFLCGRAIASLWREVSIMDPAAAEALAARYLHRVVHMHEKPLVTTSLKDVSDELSTGATLPKERHDCAEANFSLAFSAVCLGPDALSAAQSQCKVETHSTVLGSSTFPAVNEEEIQLSKEYLQEFLDLCDRVKGGGTRERFICHILSLSANQATPVMQLTSPNWSNMSTEKRADVVLPTLSSMFDLFNESTTRNAAGSATASFAVWLGVSWNCASFSWQARVARGIGDLLADLEAKFCRPGSLSHSAAVSKGWGSNARARTRAGISEPRPFAASEPGQELNLFNLLTTMRRICEGRPLEDKGLLEALVQSGSGAMLQLRDYNNILEHIFAEQISSSSGGQDTQQQQQWNHSILSNIMSGVLLYSQFYLSVRSLEAALRCSQMAVLVGHQWRSSELLTIAHYNSFLVHIACQDTPAAAGDITIMLQLADAAIRRENEANADMNAPRFHAGCLGYMGAVLLLLICPGTVDTSLRSVIISGIDAGSRNSSDAFGNHSDNQNYNNGVNISHTAEEAVAVGGSVVVQTIAQTVRHALWLSEMESFLDPSSTAATEVITTVARGTMILMAGHYGVRSFLKPITALSLAQLLEVIEETSLSSTPTAYQPSGLLLREAMRQTAHHALAVQIGTAEAADGTGPLHILHDFLVGVEENYGEEGMEIVQHNFFFVSTYRFLCAMWLRVHGFMKSAYQELTRIADSMVFYSRGCTGSFTEKKTAFSAFVGARGTNIWQSNGPSDVANEEAEIFCENFAMHGPEESAAEASGTTKGEQSREGEDDGLQYWPPDHLLLWQHVQFERALLAHYLGYSCTLLEIGDSLRRVSAASHFAMGVLYADLIAALTWMQRRNYCGALQSLDKVLSSAEGIGLTLLQHHARARRVSVLMSCNRWKEASDTLCKSQPVPSVMMHWFLVARLHVQCELLLSSNTATEGDLSGVIQQHVEEMTLCGCFLEESQQTDTTCIALCDKLCAYACIARHSITHSTQSHSWESALNATATKLQIRQLQEGKWQPLTNTPMRRICKEVLSGTLLQRVLEAH
ncbi:hypothetical protein ERJ75_000827500 [Trypanosoma vivax]|nr:hypothetical protein TRVL_03325 [Trypanosoma vivax]KAH8613006.1 hypothetical protein ERJ75_000827500 [Trypanosoma vivax]